MAAYDAAIAQFVAGEPVAPDTTLPPAAQQLLLGLVTPANLPFARELWSADASALLERIRIPVLVVIGKKDLQVDWQLDGKLLQRAAAANADVTFAYAEHANHVLKYERNRGASSCRPKWRVRTTPPTRGWMQMSRRPS
jgi:pimeloyl-ACP methyl ester carboxylesterase